MQICSPCFRKSDSVAETVGFNGGSRSCANKVTGVEFRAKFYCCGRVPPEGLYRKRHGMCDVQDLSTESTVELAIDAYEYTNFGLQKVINPTVPYIEDLPEELYQGRAIEIQGKLLENAIRFSINLSTGKDNNADLGMHFNPRFDRHVVIRNHRIKNKWGVEEIVSLRPFPFRIGKNFSVLIFVTDEQFLIAVNRIHYCAFAFRLPIEKIKSLLIVGDIILKVVQHSDKTCYPPQTLKKIPAVIVPHAIKNESENFKCDIRRRIKAIKVGTKIDIFGRLKLLPRAFYINLQKGASIWPHPIVPFHMNLRFHPPGTHKREKEIIFNSWSNGFWGKEEIISFCPFLPGTAFHIKIICKPDSFNVLVNDKILFNYRRVTIDLDVDSIFLHGDIIVNKVIIH